MAQGSGPLIHDELRGDRHAHRFPGMGYTTGKISGDLFTPFIGLGQVLFSASGVGVGVFHEFKELSFQCTPCGGKNRAHNAMAVEHRQRRGSMCAMI